MGKAYDDDDATGRGNYAPRFGVAPDGPLALSPHTPLEQATTDPKEIPMKRILLLAALGTAVVTFAVPASAAPGSATLVVRHQIRGCHSWSLNGGPWKVMQHLRLARGGSIVVTNNDVMYHQIVKTSGPAILFRLLKVGTPMKGTLKLPWAPGVMGRPGASVKITFPKAGTYRLTTKFGEDYMPMGETIGEDNVLRAVVVVA